MLCNININKHKEISVNPKYKDYIGQKYNHWTIIDISTRPKLCGIEFICKYD